MKLIHKYWKYKGLATFYKVESFIWKSLYTNQRGGKAFNELQQEVIKLREDNRRLWKN